MKPIEKLLEILYSIAITIVLFQFVVNICFNINIVNIYF